MSFKQVPRKWGGSGSEKEEENLDFSAETGSGQNGASDLAADMSKVSLVDREDDEDTDSELEGQSYPMHLLSGYIIPLPSIYGTCRSSGYNIEQA